MKSFDEIRVSLRESAVGKAQHHYTSGIDAEPDEKGHYDKEDSNFLKKTGNAAKKQGMKVSYSTADVKGSHSSELNRKHNLIHISHHDPKAVHKLLAKHGHSNDEEFTHEYLKSKTHGGHSEATAEYHGHDGAS